MPTHHTINYIEFPSHDLSASQAFFEQVFDWAFESYGPTYIAFRDANGMDGGFYESTQNSHSTAGAPLVILYSQHLEKTLEAVSAAGGKVLKEIFTFPGGRRFHFQEPGGNEIAIWSE